MATSRKLHENKAENKLKNFFKKDNFLFGILLAVTLPLIIFGIIILIKLIFGLSGDMKYLNTNHLFLYSICSLLIPIRIYFVNWKFEKTGRGILALLFVFMIVLFAFFM